MNTALQDTKHHCTAAVNHPTLPAGSGPSFPRRGWFTYALIFFVAVFVLSPLTVHADAGACQLKASANPALCAAADCPQYETMATCQPLPAPNPECCEWKPLAPGPEAPVKRAVRPVVELDNPLGSCDKKSLSKKDYEACMDKTTNLLRIAGRVANTGLGVLGSAALVVFLYGGFLWMTSAGNDEKVHAGLNAMMYAAIGIFIIFGSYAAVAFIIKGITAS